MVQGLKGPKGIWPKPNLDSEDGKVGGHDVEDKELVVLLIPESRGGVSEG